MPCRVPDTMHRPSGKADVSPSMVTLPLAVSRFEVALSFPARFND